ncbi:MAG: 23S rRNA (adenine(2503)-C(2))-methyltransferase RlmN [Deltaproteobacteria bacterium]|jgi:23S rRNA (adenine2503-C2)-methyltransferase|nr:23S rRNA (adenine(2503)-C(2))-methyltransferase RlmN [Deltaproteobacteria bacterium]
MSPLTEPGAAKIRLLDLSPEEIGAFLSDWGERPYRAEQLTGWIFRKAAASWGEMTDIAAKTRARLARTYDIAPVLTPLLLTESQDQTKKIVWQLSDGTKTESVLIPERDHVTLCLSSQVGCGLGCRFCRTGDMGFKRNLTQGEILGQVFGAKKFLSPDQNLTNLVFMGMGEPLLNPESTVKSLAVLTSPKFLAFSGRHISLSTAGVVPEIYRMGALGLDFGLTVSLGAPTDELRDGLMPINRRYPLKELKRALKAYPLKKGRRITIAYVLLKDVNDGPHEALELSRFLTGLKTKINLIPFNPWSGAPYDRPKEETILKFQKILRDKYHTVIIRRSKGRDIAGACGQLAGQA